METSKKYLLFLSLLISLFLAYNFIIYTSKEDYETIHLSEKALQGESIWLKKNCNSCHQFYGLGGYLGPDLTNIYSKRDEANIKAMLNSGVNAMQNLISKKMKKKL